MWQALRDIVNTAKESLGIEAPTVPDTTAVVDAVAGVTDPTDEAVTTATEAVAGAGEQVTSKLSDLFSRLGG